MWPAVTSVSFLCFVLCCFGFQLVASLATQDGFGKTLVVLCFKACFPSHFIEHIFGHNAPFCIPLFHKTLRSKHAMYCHCLPLFFSHGFPLPVFMGLLPSFPLIFSLFSCPLLYLSPRFPLSPLLSFPSMFSSLLSFPLLSSLKPSYKWAFKGVTDVFTPFRLHSQSSRWLVTSRRSECFSICCSCQHKYDAFLNQLFFFSRLLLYKFMLRFVWCLALWRALKHTYFAGTKAFFCVPSMYNFFCRCLWQFMVVLSPQQNHSSINYYKEISWEK